MDQEELCLWHSINVKGYIASVSIYQTAISRLEKVLSAGGTEPPSIWSVAKERHKKIQRRYSKIDLNPLDERFPLEILVELKNEVIPGLGDAFRDLDTELQWYFADHTAYSHVVRYKMFTSQSLMDRMRDLGFKFAELEGYNNYIKERIPRIETD